MSFKPKHSIKKYVSPFSPKSAADLATQTKTSGIQASPSMAPTQSPSFLGSKNSTASQQFYQERFRQINEQNKNYKQTLEMVKKEFKGIFNENGLELPTKTKDYFKSYGQTEKRMFNKSSSIGFTSPTKIISRGNKDEPKAIVAPLFEKRRRSMATVSFDERDPSRNLTPLVIQSSSYINVVKQPNLQSARVNSRDSIREMNEVLKTKLNYLEKVVPLGEGVHKPIHIFKAYHPSVTNIESSMNGRVSQQSPDLQTNQSITSRQHSKRLSVRNYSVRKDSKSTFQGAQNLILDAKQNRNATLVTEQDIYEDEDEESTLPKVPDSNIDKNLQLLDIYEQQLEKQKKRIIMGIDKETIIEEANKIIIKKRASEFIEAQNKKLKDRISHKRMGPIDKARLLEEINQQTLHSKKEEQKKIEKHKKDIDKVLTAEKAKHKVVENEEEPQKIVKQMTTISQDSPEKNIGAIGQYISRVLEDREENPEKYPDTNSDDGENHESEPQTEKNPMNETLNKSKRSWKAKKMGSSAKSSFVQISDGLFRGSSDLKLKLKFSQLNIGRTSALNSPPRVIEEADFAKSVKIDNKISLDLFKQKKSMMMQALTEEEMSSLDVSKSTFARHFPDFRTGITPIRRQNESDLDSFEIKAQREMINQQERKQQLFKKKDFDEIHKRQKQFKKLMETTQSSKMDQSEIIPINTQKSEFENFPFLKQGQGTYIKAYNTAEIRPDFVNRFSPAKPPIELESDASSNYPHLAQKFRNLGKIEETKIRNKIAHYLDYVVVENFKDNILQVQERLGQETLQKGFQNFESLPNKQMQVFAKHIYDRNKFYDICKNASTPKAQEALINDPNLIFYKKCLEKNVPVLSLLQKIDNKALNLKGYYVNQEQCGALLEAFQQFPDFIDTLLLDNNGLKDKGLSMIIEGLISQNNFTKFVCLNNEMQYNSLIAMKNLLEKPYPNCLLELRLVSCKLNMTLADNLLDFIIQTGNLQKLGLVRVNLSQNSLDKLLILFTNTNKNLIEIDLSWNDLLPISMQRIAEALSTNRNLQKVNLSWNAVRNMNCIAFDQKEITDSEKDTITNLCKFIKYNPKLLHMDLSKTGLSDKMLLFFGPALRRAKSLISLHLSGNPGIDRDIIDSLFKRAHCQPKFQLNVIDEVARDNLEKIADGFKPQDQLIEGIKLKQFENEKCKTVTGNDSKQIDNNKLVFDRVLGHKQDLPGSGQWRQLTKVNEKCWICEDYVYSIIFWSRKIGWSCEGQIDGVVEEKMIQRLGQLQQRITSQIEQDIYPNKEHRQAYNLDLGMPGSSDAPVIYGQFTNWHPMKMVLIEDYCDMIDTNQPDFIGRLIGSGQCRGEVVTPDDFNDQEQEYYDEMKAQYKKSYLNTWNQLIQTQLLYKKPNFVNDHLVLHEDQYGELSPRPYDNHDPIYVFPCFIKPGKHYFIVRADPPPPKLLKSMRKQLVEQDQPEDDEPAKADQSVITSSLTISDHGVETQYFSHSMVAPPRTEEIPIVEKSYGSVSNEIVFKKNQSVFKNWVDLDTIKKIEMSTEHDFELWKLEKFCKDEYDQQKTKEIIIKNFDLLKILHLYFASRSNFPYINNYEFMQFVLKFGFTDTNETVSFISATSQSKISGTQDSQVLRFQFLEIIVRLADNKYRVTKKVTKTFKALQQFLEKDLIPFAKEITDEWDGWRERNLWTLECNDMLKVNTEGIKKLMERYYQPRQKWLPMKDACEIFTRETDLLLEKDALFMYGMSKMPIIKDTADIQKLKIITQITELYEMIGRTAEFKFKDQNLPLAQKIGLVLDKILPIVKMKRQDPNKGEIVDESQSDEDY